MVRLRIDFRGLGVAAVVAASGTVSCANDTVCARGRTNSLQEGAMVAHAHAGCDASMENVLHMQQAGFGFGHFWRI